MSIGDAGVWHDGIHYLTYFTAALFTSLISF